MVHLGEVKTRPEGTEESQKTAKEVLDVEGFSDLRILGSINPRWRKYLKVQQSMLPRA